MKKLVVLGVTVLSVMGFCNTAAAQGKTGYINREVAIGLMPEAEKANNELQELQTGLQEQGVQLAKELQEKDSAFVADSLKMNKVKKDLMKKDLFELYQKVQSWNQFIQEELEKKQQVLVAPIQTKLMNAIKDVAKESGYSYILDATAVIVGPPGEDVLPLVKKKLGIKDTPATPAKTGTRPAGQ